MTHKDFLGRELQVGDYCSFPGGGNSSTEYGLILHKVVKLSDKGVRTQRLRIRYPDYTEENAVANHSNTTIKKPGKLTKVTPPPNMIRVFENPDEHGALIGKWLHGQAVIDWENLTWE